MGDNWDIWNWTIKKKKKNFSILVSYLKVSHLSQFSEQKIKIHLTQRIQVSPGEAHWGICNVFIYSCFSNTVCASEVIKSFGVCNNGLFLFWYYELLTWTGKKDKDFPLKNFIFGSFFVLIFYCCSSMVVSITIFPKATSSFFFFFKHIAT